MVLVLDSWPSFKEYFERWGDIAELTYRIDHREGKNLRVRIMAGRYGLDATYTRDDPTLQEIQDFLSSHGGRRVEGSKNVEQFFL